MRRSGSNFDIVSNLDVGGAGFNKATVAAIRGTGIERAANIHRARRHAAQDDGAIVLLHRVRFDHACVVNHTGKQRIFGAGVHQHHPTISAN